MEEAATAKRSYYRLDLIPLYLAPTPFSAVGFVYKIIGIPQSQSDQSLPDESTGESSGDKKCRLDIVKLKAEYNYSIELYAKTSAGQGLTPAVVNASTISMEVARPLVPIDVTISHRPSGVKVSWNYDEETQFRPENYTLLYRIKGQSAWTSELIPPIKSPYKVLDM